jgi:3'(2'), 5'-bisphosphate nucleotidase
MSAPSMDAPLISDGELAARLAEAAGRILINVRDCGAFDGSSQGKALGRAGDATANAFLCHSIRTMRPEDGLLSEEEKDDTARCALDRVWVIDPVDGTREYGEKREDWAVHVGLAIGGKAAVGAVALPGLGDGRVFRSDMPAELSAPRETPRFLVSRSRPAPIAEKVCAALGGKLVAMGSAGAKAMAVVRGEAEIYLHSGGQYEWDSCAPAAVAQAHGLHTSRIDGSPLRYNNANTYLPDLLICRAEWAQRVLAAIAVSTNA